MATYKLLNFSKRKTTTGKDVADLELEGVTGKVSMWGDHPHFAGLNVGYTVDGDVVEKGQYKTLYAPRTPQKPQGGGFAGKAMETKAANIEHAQKAKAAGIEISATARDATLIITNFYKDLTNEQIKEKWIYWRKWLLSNWENPEGRDSHGNETPF